MALTEIDRNLLKQCIAEEPGAWKKFVDRFMGLFVHVIHHTAHARSIKLRPDDIDDLCADVFVALLANNYSALRAFRGRSSLATYLTVIARRVVVRKLIERRMAEAWGHVDAHKAAVGNSTNPTHEKRIEDRDEVQRMLGELSETDAAIVREFHLEGRSYREISSRLGVNENSIGPTLARARERLRQRQVNS